MFQPGTGTAAQTFAATAQTNTFTIAGTLTHTEAIAGYLRDDLEHFVHEAGIDLFSYLHVPGSMTHDLNQLLEMLYDDLAHLLRENLIIGVHLILASPDPDPAHGGAYPIRYHAQYVIDMAVRGFSDDPEARFGGLPAPPLGSWIDARFALVVDWAPDSTSERRATANSENGYWFDWVPPQEHFSAVNLIPFREGGMSIGSTAVDRQEWALSGLVQ